MSPSAHLVVGLDEGIPGHREDGQVQNPLKLLSTTAAASSSFSRKTSQFFYPGTPCTSGRSI